MYMIDIVQLLSTVRTHMHLLSDTWTWCHWVEHVPSPWDQTLKLGICEPSGFGKKGYGVCLSMGF